MVVKNQTTMNIVQIYKQFPDHASCIKHLEKVRWNDVPKCPYCGSLKVTPAPKELRYHCNNCNTSFSVTVGTVFHKTKLDLQIWFLAVSLVLNAKKGISARQLARDINVTKDTGWFMLMRLRRALIEYGDLLEGIVEADETYVGGKNKNRHADKKTKGGQGRGGKDKTAVIGLLERGGNVKARKAKDVSGKTLKSFIKQNVKEGSQLMTDEWKSYNGLSLLYGHSIINHSMGEYVNGCVHTNTLEGFWSLLKRGVIGQYHYVTPRYLNKYVDEFCFRYNNRKNSDIFELTMQKAVNIN
jgi:transposase-like protein